MQPTNAPPQREFTFSKLGEHIFNGVKSDIELGYFEVTGQWYMRANDVARIFIHVTELNPEVVDDERVRGATVFDATNQPCIASSMLAELAKAWEKDLFSIMCQYSAKDVLDTAWAGTHPQIMDLLTDLKIKPAAQCQPPAPAPLPPQQQVPPQGSAHLTRPSPSHGGPPPQQQQPLPPHGSHPHLQPPAGQPPQQQQQPGHFSQQPLQHPPMTQPAFAGRGGPGAHPPMHPQFQQQQQPPQQQLAHGGPPPPPGSGQSPRYQAAQPPYPGPPGTTPPHLQGQGGPVQQTRPRGASVSDTAGGPARKRARYEGEAGGPQQQQPQLPAAAIVPNSTVASAIPAAARRMSVSNAMSQMTPEQQNEMARLREQQAMLVQSQLRTANGAAAMSGLAVSSTAPSGLPPGSGAPPPPPQMGMAQQQQQQQLHPQQQHQMQQQHYATSSSAPSSAAPSPAVVTGPSTRNPRGLTIHAVGATPSPALGPTAAAAPPPGYVSVGPGAVAARAVAGGMGPGAVMAGGGSVTNGGARPPSRVGRPPRMLVPAGGAEGAPGTGYEPDMHLGPMPAGPPPAPPSSALSAEARNALLMNVSSTVTDYITVLMSDVIAQTPAVAAAAVNAAATAAAAAAAAPPPVAVAAALPALPDNLVTVEMLDAKLKPILEMLEDLQTRVKAMDTAVEVNRQTSERMVQHALNIAMEASVTATTAASTATTAAAAASNQFASRSPASKRTRSAMEADADDDEDDIMDVDSDELAASPKSAAAADKAEEPVAPQVEEDSEMTHKQLRERLERDAMMEDTEDEEDKDEGSPVAGDGSEQEASSDRGEDQGGEEEDAASGDGDEPLKDEEEDTAAAQAEAGADE